MLLFLGDVGLEYSPIVIGLLLALFFFWRWLLGRVAGSKLGQGILAGIITLFTLPSLLYVLYFVISISSLASKSLPHTSLFMDVKDSNGTLLAEGDSVTLIKDLKVKGSSQTLKRGTLVKNIRLTNSPAEIEGRAGGSTMVLKTEFLKKA